jgi:hypothetical protein
MGDLNNFPRSIAASFSLVIFVVIIDMPPLPVANRQVVKSGNHRRVWEANVVSK